MLFRSATAAVNDPRVVAVRRCVTVAPDPQLKKIQARVRLVLKDGRSVETFVENALGTLARPMSDADLERKFRGLAGEVLATSAADALVALCWSAEQLADGGAIARATVPQAAK